MRIPNKENILIYESSTNYDNTKYNIKWFNYLKINLDYNGISNKNIETILKSSHNYINLENIKLNLNIEQLNNKIEHSCNSFFTKMNEYLINNNLDSKYELKNNCNIDNNNLYLNPNNIYSDGSIINSNIELLKK